MSAPSSTNADGIINFFRNSDLNELFEISDEEISTFLKAGEQSIGLLQSKLKKGESPIDVLKWYFGSGAGMADLYKSEKTKK